MRQNNLRANIEIDDTWIYFKENLPGIAIAPNPSVNYISVVKNKSPNYYFIPKDQKMTYKWYSTP